MDFGIAQLADGAALTAAGDVVGTLAYMSPEQAEGRHAGPEADVYSLALTLYECWSGENPHRRSSPAATARAIGDRTRPLRRLRPDLPRELTDEIDACLSPGPTTAPRWSSWAPRSRTRSTCSPTSTQRRRHADLGVRLGAARPGALGPRRLASPSVHGTPASADRPANI